MNVNSDHNPEGEDKKFRVYNKAFKFENAPLAAPEDDSDDLAEYAQVKDEYGNDMVEQNMYTFPHDGTPNKSKIRHRRDNKGQSTDIVFMLLQTNFVAHTRRNNLMIMSIYLAIVSFILQNTQKRTANLVHPSERIHEAMMVITK